MATPAIVVSSDAATLGAAGDTQDVSVPVPAADLSRTFARIAGPRFASSGRSAADTASLNNVDLGVAIELIDPATIRFSRRSTAEDVDHTYHWEVWSYNGPAGDPSEFIVRQQGKATLPDGVGTIDVPVSGIDDLGDCVPFIAALDPENATRTWAEATATAEMAVAGSDVVRFKREDTDGELVVSYAVVEFVGSAWTVQNDIEHQFAAAAATEQELIADVGDWSTAFVVHSYRARADQHGLREIGYNVWPHPSDSDVLRFRLHAGAPDVGLGGYVAVAHVVQHAGMFTQHLDSIDGTVLGYATDDAFFNVVVTPYGLGQRLLGVGAAAIASADSLGAGTAYPRNHWNARLLETGSTCRFRRGRSGSDGDWALQRIGFPQTFYPATIDSEAVLPSVALELGIELAPVEAEALLPAAILERVLGPDPIDAEALIEPPTLERVLAPGPVEVEVSLPVAMLSLEIAPSPVEAEAVLPAIDLDALLLALLPVEVEVTLPSPYVEGVRGCVLVRKVGTALQVDRRLELETQITRQLSIGELIGRRLEGATTIERQLRSSATVERRLELECDP